VGLLLIAAGTIPDHNVVIWGFGEELVYLLHYGDDEGLVWVK